MNHGTILEQNYRGPDRGAAREMVITVFVRDCLIMNHGTIIEQDYRGAARDEFCRICLIDSVFDRVGFAHGPWNHF